MYNTNLPIVSTNIFMINKVTSLVILFLYLHTNLCLML